ncbi:MAG: hypothetical protein ABSF10_03500 [Verrucomicrobiota bacterium]
MGNCASRGQSANSYLNAVLLTRGIEGEVIFATPARLAKMLRCGRQLNSSH